MTDERLQFVARRLAGEPMAELCREEVRSTATTVEIFHRGQRVASHVRCRERGRTITQHEHRPKSHQAHLAWPPSRMVNWARRIGPHTAQLFERILSEKPHPEMGYRSCLGIIRLAEQYSAERMEAAAERALLAQACRYHAATAQRSPVRFVQSRNVRFHRGREARWNRRESS